MLQAFALVLCALCVSHVAADLQCDGLADGAFCDDGNDNTTIDSCLNGNCTGACPETLVLVDGSCIQSCPPLDTPHLGVLVTCPAQALVRFLAFCRFAWQMMCFAVANDDTNAPR
jgi:hypothetical protein